MKKLLKTLKKHWTRVWLVCVLLAVSVFVTIAAYTEVSSVKRVVSTKSSPGVPFSSNCMKTQLSSRRLSSAQFNVTVCNFDQDYPTSFSPSRISYQLEAELRVKQGNDYLTMAELKNTVSNELYQSYVAKAANYTIQKTTDDKDGTVSSSVLHFTDTNGYKFVLPSSSEYDHLEAKKSSIDVYSVNIDPEDPRSEETLFFVYLTAKPKNSALPNLLTRLYGTKSKDEEASWSGSIVEANTGSVDYDFYNYVITGSGKGYVDLMWNPQVVEVNKFFLEENQLEKSTIAATDANYSDRAGWNLVTIPVNATEKSRYELQLYKVQENVSLLSPSGSIDCKFRA